MFLFLFSSDSLKLRKPTQGGAMKILLKTFLILTAISSVAYSQQCSEKELQREQDKAEWMEYVKETMPPFESTPEERMNWSKNLGKECARRSMQNEFGRNPEYAEQYPELYQIYLDAESEIASKE